MNPFSPLPGPADVGGARRTHHAGSRDVVDEDDQLHPSLPLVRLLPVQEFGLKEAERILPLVPDNPLYTLASSPPGLTSLLLSL